MEVYLVVPGLLGPLPRGAAPAAIPRVRVLEHLLSRALGEMGPRDLAAALFPLFGCPAHPSPATAALSYLADSGNEPPGWICHADPVHLIADQNRLLVYDAPQADLASSEASAFVEAFNDHFSHEGLRLEAPRPERWYLSAERAPAVRFHALDAVIGRNLDPFLPAGPEEQRWRGLLNEVQMLFHALPVNAERESQGKAIVNGLWFSGAGTAPRCGPPLVSHATGEGALLEGLCCRAGVRRTTPDEVLAGGGLVLFSGLHRALLDADMPAWQEALRRLELLLTELTPANLTIVPCDGRSFRYRSGLRRRWWRRTLPLSRWLVAGD